MGNRVSFSGWYLVRRASDDQHHLVRAGLDERDRLTCWIKQNGNSIDIFDDDIIAKLGSLEEFDVNELLEKKMVSLLFFKIGVEYRLEIYDQLKVMLNTIKYL